MFQANNAIQAIHANNVIFFPEIEREIGGRGPNFEMIAWKFGGPSPLARFSNDVVLRLVGRECPVTDVRLGAAVINEIAEDVAEVCIHFAIPSASLNLADAFFRAVRGPFQSLTDGHVNVNATLHIVWKSADIADVAVPKALWGDLSFLVQEGNTSMESRQFGCVDVQSIESAIVEYEDDVDDVSLSVHMSATAKVGLWDAAVHLVQAMPRNAILNPPGLRIY
jgi:hypothetical protein